MLNFFLPHRLEGEKIILLVRRHPFVIFIKIGFWLLVALLPPIFFLFLNTAIKAAIPTALYLPLLYTVGSLFYLYVWLFLVFSFVDYYLDVWIITNERILDIEQKGLFNRIASEQKLYRVQDITAEIKGFFQTILNFGEVYVQTAGEKQRFVFRQVYRPEHVAKKIIDLAEANKKFHKVTNKDEE